MLDTGKPFPEAGWGATVSKGPGVLVALFYLRPEG